MTRRFIQREVLRDLAIRSKNKCAFPGCDRPLLNQQGLYVAELCHIEAAEPGGQRYNPLQTDEERRSPENLLFLCHEHHKETDDVIRYSAQRLREIKRAHEALPEVVFNTELMLNRIEEVVVEQVEIRKLLQGNPKASPKENYSIIGPELRESWTPESGRFYETSTGNKKKFKYMMRDGCLHIEQTLEDGTIAYYEVNEEGSVPCSRMPYPINEYRVVIPDELVLRRERVPSNIGTHAVRTMLKWSKDTVTEHFRGSTFVGADCSGRCAIDHKTKTITILSPPGA